MLVIKFKLFSMEQHKLIITFFQLATSQKIDADLGPLIEPEPVTFSFDTFGWKVFFCSVLISIVLLTTFNLVRYVKNKYRRIAVKKLRSIIGEQNASNSQKLVIVNTLLKRVAIQVYGRKEVARLFGEDWMAFLESKCSKTSFIQHHTIFKNATFELNEISDFDLETVLLTTKKWIKYHAR